MLPLADAEDRAMEELYYERLEAGARWLASRTGAGAERDAHLGHAGRYARLRLDASSGVR